MPVLQESDAASTPHDTNRGQRDPAFLLELGGGIEPRSQHRQQLEVLSPLRRKPAGRYSEPGRLSTDICLQRKSTNIYLERNTGRGGDMPGIAGKAVTEIDQRMRAVLCQPAAGRDSGFRTGKALSRA